MKKSQLWFLALLLTLLIAYYQRVTGPTYPVKDTVVFNSEKIHYELARTHGGESDHNVIIAAKDPSTDGFLFWKKYKTDDDFSKVRMHRDEGVLTASLPSQPPAGKLEYYVELKNIKESLIVPSDRTVVIRFKGVVPLWILIPHIIIMFSAMLFSTRTGLEFIKAEKFKITLKIINYGSIILSGIVLLYIIFFNFKLFYILILLGAGIIIFGLTYLSRNSDYKTLTYWTVGLLFAGGLILGPIVQYYAFGEFWTGIPFGHDLTDNKTLIAFIGWLTALFLYARSKRPQLLALFAALLLTIVYLIPHSVLGSELDYNKLDNQKVESQK